MFPLSGCFGIWILNSVYGKDEKDNFSNSHH